MCDQQSLRSACAYAQPDQSLCLSLEYSMIVKLLTEHHLEFLSLTGGCTGSSETTHVKMHCWKSHALAHIITPLQTSQQHLEEPQANQPDLFLPIKIIAKLEGHKVMKKTITKHRALHQTMGEAINNEPLTTESVLQSYPQIVRLHTEFCQISCCIILFTKSQVIKF